MSLRKDVAKILWDFENDGRVYTVVAQEIISLCMDAAIDKINKRREYEKLSYKHHKDKWHSAEEWHLTRHGALFDAIEDIQALKNRSEEEKLLTLESTEEWPDNWPESACEFGDLANERIYKLTMICKEIREIYAGRDGYVCETPLSIYQEKLIKQMYDFAAKAYEV